LEAAVSGEGDDVVVEEGVVGGIVASRSTLSGDGVTDGICDTLTERSRGGFDPFSFVKLGVAGSFTVENAEVLHFVEGEIVTGKVKPGVDEHGSVSGGEDEAVAVEPFRSGGVKAKEQACTASIASPRACAAAAVRMSVFIGGVASLLEAVEASLKGEVFVARLMRACRILDSCLELAMVL